MTATFGATVVQIILIDMVFSVDSILAAVGLTQVMWVIVVAILVSVAVMLLSMDALSNFMEKNPTVVMLALAFLVMIGMVLVGEGFDIHMPKGFVYVAMAFAAAVEGLNIWARRGRERRQRPRRRPRRRPSRGARLPAEIGLRRKRAEPGGGQRGQQARPPHKWPGKDHAGPAGAMPARVRRAASSGSIRIRGMGKRLGAVIGVRTKPGQTAWSARRPAGGGVGRLRPALEGGLGGRVGGRAGRGEEGRDGGDGGDAAAHAVRAPAPAPHEVSAGRTVLSTPVRFPRRCAGLVRGLIVPPVPAEVPALATSRSRPPLPRPRLRPPRRRHVEGRFHRRAPAAAGAAAAAQPRGIPAGEVQRRARGPASSGPARRRGRRRRR